MRPGAAWRTPRRTARRSTARRHAGRSGLSQAGRCRAPSSVRAAQGLDRRPGRFPSVPAGRRDQVTRAARRRSGVQWWTSRGRCGGRGSEGRRQVCRSFWLTVGWRARAPSRSGASISWPRRDPADALDRRAVHALFTADRAGGDAFPVALHFGCYRAGHARPGRTQGAVRARQRPRDDAQAGRSAGAVAAARSSSANGWRRPPASGPRSSASASCRGAVARSAAPMNFNDLDAELQGLTRSVEQRADYLSVVEAELRSQQVRKALLPESQPVADGFIGSGFGWRTDPFTGEMTSPRWHRFRRADRDADPCRGRRGRRACRAPSGLWQRRRDRSRHGTDDALCARQPADRQRRRTRQARPEDRRSRQLPAVRPARTCTSRSTARALRRTRRSSCSPRAILCSRRGGRRWTSAALANAATARN